MFSRRIRLLGLGIATTATVGFLGAGPAMANDSDVVARGHCSTTSHWKLKAGTRSHDRLRAEFEVDSNVADQTWNVTVSHNGTTVLDNSQVTDGGGEFEVRVRVPDAAGTDSFTGSATNPTTGETCTGTVTV
jgi:hypothetical protein